MMFPIVELVDRLLIAQIKFEKSLDNKAELDWYTNQCNELDLTKISKDLDELKNIHLEIWDLEADLKSFKEKNQSLEEIGRRAIMIRDLNHQRILLKNRMAEILGCRVREIKHDHASE
jgi:hypothetical protein